MAKFRSIKNSLIAGEISPTCFGRTDLAQYAHACKLLRNSIPMISGGAYRRPGTLFHKKFTSAGTPPRLIPFVASQSEPYMLALYDDGSGISATEGVLEAYRPRTTLGSSAAATITGHHPYNPNLSFAYSGMFDDIQYAQSVDVMTLVHPLFKPYRVNRTAIDAFSVVPFDNGLTGSTLRDAWPYRPQNTTAITMGISAASVGTGRTVSSSAPFFASTHVGAMFKSDDGAGTVGCFLVTGFTNSTTVTVTVIVALGTTGAKSTWWESAWSDYRGWPRTVGFFKGRIAYGGNATDRDSLWFSQSANFDAMSVSTITLPNSSPTGSQPFTLTMSSQQLSLIQWISPDKTLTVGTEGDEFIIDVEQPGGFGCDNCAVTAQGHFGSSYHMAVRPGDELLFATQANDAVIALIFNLYENSYNAEPVQTLFDEYPKPDPITKARKYRNFTWDQSRNTLWCCDTAGNLFGMTRNRSLGVTMWHSHQMGGFDSTQTVALNLIGGGLCSGSVVSVAVLPNPTLGVNDVWMTVIRKINGAFQWHVERFMGKGFSSDTAANAAPGTSGNYLLDSCVFDVNGFTTSIPETHISAGIYADYSHLEGATVSGNASSARGMFTLQDSIVASGAVHLVAPYPPAYSTINYEIAFGLPYSSIVAPVRIEAGSQIGTAQGAIKRIHRATARFYKTLSAKIGASADQLETIIFREGSTAMGFSPELYTGDKLVDLEGDYDRDGYIYILQDKPLPFCLVSIITEGETHD